MAVQFSEPALEDLDNIWRYLAQRSSKNATRFITHFDDVFSLLDEFPQIGRERNDLRLGIRSYVYQRYLVLYRQVEQDVLIEAIIRGDRDIEGMFS